VWAGPGSAEAGRLAVPDVHQVGQGVVGADWGNEIALKALRDHDHSHRRVARTNHSAA